MRTKREMIGLYREQNPKSPVVQPLAKSLLRLYCTGCRERSIT
jgi:hypothetical protein